MSKLIQQYSSSKGVSMVGAKIHESYPANGIFLKYFIVGIFNAPPEIIMKSMTKFCPQLSVVSTQRTTYLLS